MIVHADAQERATVVPAGVFKQRQRGRLCHAIVRLLALSALIVLVLGSLVVVLWTEPYPSRFIGLSFLAVALYGAWRLSHGVATALIPVAVLTGVLLARNGPWGFVLGDSWRRCQHDAP